MNTAFELQKIIEGEVITDDLELKKYSRDTSIFEMTPSVVVKPKNREDLKSLVKYASENKKKNPSLSLTARAAGTDMSGGPLTTSISVNFLDHFNHIKSITENYTIVEPGVFFRDLEAKLDEKNLLYPPYPASKQLCAIGGIVNNNSGGEKTLQFGKTNKYILGLNTVLSDGQEHYFEKISKTELNKKIKSTSFEGKLYKKIYNLLSKNEELIYSTRPQVSKNSSGYNIWDVIDSDGNFDMTQLICGAQGTLGFVTEAKLKLVPNPQKERLYVVFIKNMKDLPNFVQDVLKLKPTSLEITDDHTFKIYLKYAKEMAELLGSHGVLGTMKLFMPETMLIARHGMPKLIVLVEFEGDETSVLSKEVKQLEQIIKKYKMVGHFCRKKKDSDKYWKLRRDTFKLLREKITNRHSTPFVDDIIVRPEYLPEFLPKLTEILDRYKLFYTISGHLGDGNLHIIPLMDLKNPQEREKIYPSTDEVYKLVLEYKGSLSAEHNDGLIRSPYLEEQFGTRVYKIFSEIKDTFDPLNIFNSHKKIGVTKEFAKSYMITT